MIWCCGGCGAKLEDIFTIGIVTFRAGRHLRSIREVVDVDAVLAREVKLSELQMPEELPEEGIADRGL